MKIRSSVLAGGVAVGGGLCVLLSISPDFAVFLYPVFGLLGVGGFLARNPETREKIIGLLAAPPSPKLLTTGDPSLDAVAPPAVQQQEEEYQATPIVLPAASFSPNPPRPATVIPPPEPARESVRVASAMPEPASPGNDLLASLLTNRSTGPRPSGITQTFQIPGAVDTSGLMFQSGMSFRWLDQFFPTLDRLSITPLDRVLASSAKGAINVLNRAGCDVVRSVVGCAENEALQIGNVGVVNCIVRTAPNDLTIRALCCKVRAVAVKPYEQGLFAVMVVLGRPEAVEPAPITAPPLTIQIPIVPAVHQRELVSRELAPVDHVSSVYRVSPGETRPMVSARPVEPAAPVASVFQTSNDDAGSPDDDSFWETTELSDDSDKDDPVQADEGVDEFVDDGDSNITSLTTEPSLPARSQDLLNRIRRETMPLSPGDEWDVLSSIDIADNAPAMTRTTSAAGPDWSPVKRVPGRPSDAVLRDFALLPPIWRAESGVPHINLGVNQYGDVVTAPLSHAGWFGGTGGGKTTMQLHFGRQLLAARHPTMNHGVVTLFGTTKFTEANGYGVHIGPFFRLFHNSAVFRSGPVGFEETGEGSHRLLVWLRGEMQRRLGIARQKATNFPPIMAIVDEWQSTRVDIESLEDDLRRKQRESSRDRGELPEIELWKEMCRAFNVLLSKGRDPARTFVSFASQSAMVQRTDLDVSTFANMGIQYIHESTDAPSILNICLSNRDQRKQINAFFKEFPAAAYPDVWVVRTGNQIQPVWVPWVTNELLDLWADAIPGGAERFQREKERYADSADSLLLEYTGDEDEEGDSEEYEGDDEEDDGDYELGDDDEPSQKSFLEREVGGSSDRNVDTDLVQRLREWVTERKARGENVSKNAAVVSLLGSKNSKTFQLISDAFVALESDER